MNHKTALHPRYLASLMTLCLASISVHAEAPATPAPPKLSGPPKVQVLVQENNVAVTVGGSSAATPAPGGAKGKGQSPSPAQAAANALDAEKYTRTTKKTLTVTLVDIAGVNMDVNVKTTFLARDEGGKHEIVDEKTVENKASLQPGKAQNFITEEVSFVHTTAHRGPIKRGNGGTGAIGRNAISPMIPASGHSYYGYRVEVYQGQDLVGIASSSEMY